MRRGVAIKKAPPKPKSFKEYVETMLSETPPWALYEEGGETALDYSPYDHPKLKNVKDKKRADEISRELLDKPTWRPRLLEPENVVFVPKLEDRLDSVIDDPLIRYGKKFAKPFENVIRQGKRLVDPKLIRPKTSVQTTLPQHFPRLTTENPYDKEGRIKPGAIAPITAFKQMGRDAFNNLLSYGLIPGLTVDSLDWEESSNLRDMTPIPVKSGASFVAPVGTLDAIRGTMNQSGGRGKPIYVGIRGFAQPEDKAFLRTDSREPIEAAALGRIPPERLVLPFNIAQSGEEFGSPLSFEEWRDASKRPKSFEKFVEKIQGPKYLPLLLNAGYTQEIDDYRQLWNDRQNTQRMDYEKYLQDMKNYSIRTNLLNQRLAELGENFPPLTAKNFPMEGGRRNPYDTLYDGIYEDDFPKTIADTKNTKVRQALGAVPKEWSQNTKFNLMNPALSDAEREAIRREFQENADHEIHMSSRHDGTVDPANFNRITRGLMSAIYGPQASNMIDFRNNVGDAYSERGEKIGLEMNNPAAASLGLPNTWNAPQLFNPNFNPNQSVVKAPRITAYSPREIRDIVPDLQGIRYIPREYLESAGKPVRVHSGGKRGIGQSYDWEQDLQRLKYGLPQSGNFPKGKISEPKPLTGLFEEDKFVPKYNLAQREMVMSPVESGNIVAGQFMHPPVKEALRVPDFSANLHRPMALTGILEQPQFMREGYEGSNLLGEGFHYGELEPDSVVQLKLPYNIQPLEMARVASMREYDSPKNQRDKETMNWLSHIPSMSVPTSTEWWKQQGATEMTAPQLEQAGLFQAGEPMDIAMQLLKQEPADYADTFHRVRNNIGVDGEYMTDEELNAIDRRYSELHDDENHLEEYFNLLEMIELEQMRRRNQSFEGMGYNEETGFTRSQPMDIAMRLLKEFYIGQGDEEGYYSDEGHLPYTTKPSQFAYTAALPNFALIPNPQDPNQYKRGGSSPRLQPDGSFVGARVGRDTTDSDESTAHLANVLGHEHLHRLIEPEMEDFVTEKFGSPKLLAPVYAEPQERANIFESKSGRKKWSRNPFEIRPALNQSEIDADKERLALREQAKSFAHEYGAHQADQSSQAGVNAQLAGRPDTRDMYNQMRANQFGYYPSMQEQEQVASMMPPQPQMVQTGEPMDIAMQLLKREMSPEARQHKLEYDKKYESTPERVKYREELNRERRKRGIYGSGDHMDVSHTEGGKLTLEGEHENRARHFKERGTLRPSKIAVRKDN